MKTYFIKSALFSVWLMALLSCNETTQKTKTVEESNNKTENKM